MKQYFSLITNQYQYKKYSRPNRAYIFLRGRLKKYIQIKKNAKLQVLTLLYALMKPARTRLPANAYPAKILANPVRPISDSKSEAQQADAHAGTRQCGTHGRHHLASHGCHAPGGTDRTLPLPTPQPGPGPGNSRRASRRPNPVGLPTPK